MSEWKRDTIREAKNKLDLNFFGGMGAWKAEEVMVIQAAGRYLAEDIISEESVDNIKEGDVLYKAGHRVRIRDIAVLASVGKAMIKVFLKPTVSILSVGEELVSVIDSPKAGQIRDVNSFVLALLAEKTGVEKGQVFLVNEMDRLKEYLNYAVNRSDVVLVTGGSTTEDMNRMEEAIESMGEPGVMSCGLLMGSGAGTVIGITKDATCHCENRMPALTIAFPGDPSALAITYDIIADYFIKKYYFKTEEVEKSVNAFAGVDFVVAGTNNDETAGEAEHFVAVRLERSGEGYIAFPAEPGLAGIIASDGYAKVEGERGILKGDSIAVKLFG